MTDHTGIGYLEIARFNERLAVIAEEGGVRVVADGADLSRSANWPRPLPSLGERLAHRVPTLIENGQADNTPEGVFVSDEQLESFSDEDAELFDLICPWSPLSLELSAFGHIGTAELRLRTRFLLGDLEVDPPRVGAFVRFRGAVYRLPLPTHKLLRLVEDLNTWPPERKCNRAEVLGRWSEIAVLAGEVGAELARYLRETTVIAPERVHLDLYADEAGRVSVVPTFDGVAEEPMHQEYLRFGQIQDVYDLPAPGGARVRVVIRPEVHRALAGVAQLRRLSGVEKDRLLADPTQLLRDDPDGIAADLFRFGPRVKGIGEYPAHVRAFMSSGEKWTEVDEAPGDLKQQLVRGGLECTDHEGERKVIYFGSPDEAEELLHEMRRAQRAGRPVVEFGGVHLPVGKGLIEQLGEVVQELSERPKEAEAKEKPPRPPRTGVLIYDHLEKVEYSEGTPQEETARLCFERPGALLPHADLKPHQVEGIHWLQRTFKRTTAKGALLADDMGLGKTLQVLAFLAWAIEHPLKDSLGRDQGPYDPVLVVAPLMLLDQMGWLGEMKRFFRDSHFLPYKVLHGKELSRLRTKPGAEANTSRPLLDVNAIRDNRLVITNYDTISNYPLTFASVQWSIVVADEAHSFKDPNTLVSYTMKALKTHFRIAMTGTPVQNRLLDLWNLVDFLQPGPLLGSAREFRSKYEERVPSNEGSAGASRDTLEQLRDELRIGKAHAVLLRRTKETHLPGLPQKHEHRIECPLAEAQRALHLAFIQDGQQSNRGAGTVFSLLSRLNRLCQHPALIRQGSVSDEPSILLQASSKLEATINQLRTIRQRREKVLVFAWFRDMQDILKKVIEREFGLDVHVLNGQTPGTGQRMLEFRGRMIKEFEEKVGFNVLILSPEVAGVGLTIVGANHVLHYGRWWNPAVEDQATDRVHRIGQERDVEVYYLIATDPLGRFRTFDEHLDSLIARKRRSASDFLTPQEDSRTLQAGLWQMMEEDTAAADEGPAEVPAIVTPQDVAALSPVEFEALVAGILEAEGYRAVLTPHSNDRGVDVVAVGSTDLIFVQCKHAEAARSFDGAAVDEVVAGESFYTHSIIPPSLRNRKISLMVAANSKPDARAHRDAEQRGVRLVAGRSLLARLSGARVTRPVLDRIEGQRAHAVEEVRRRLLEIASQLGAFAP